MAIKKVGKNISNKRRQRKRKREKKCAFMPFIVHDPPGAGEDVIVLPTPSPKGVYNPLDRCGITVGSSSALERECAQGSLSAVFEGPRGAGDLMQGSYSLNSLSSSQNFHTPFSTLS